jgi:hypothetical protein
MVDTFIANASPDECVVPKHGYMTNTNHLRSSLRSIIRNLLATGPPGIAPAFSNAARSRLRQTISKPLPSPYSLFRRQTRDGYAVPLPHLQDVLTRARSLYGAGLGFLSLPVLASIVRATIGLRWEDDGDMADILAVIDADIGQAIQVSFLAPCHILHPRLIRPIPRARRKKSKEVASWTLHQHVKQRMSCAPQ